jgi:hypothetical protein
MRVVASTLVTLALLPATAGAAAPPEGLPGDYHCYMTFSGATSADGPRYWNSSDRGTITFNARYDETGRYVPTTYGIDGIYSGRPAGSGRWSWDGQRVVFLDGPLVAPDEGWSLDALYFPGHRRMPHDTERGRTSPLVIRSLTEDRPGKALAPAFVDHEGEDAYQSTYWYCGDYGHNVPDALSDALPYVRRTARIPIRLPRWLPTPYHGQALHTGRVLVAKRGYYRVGLAPQDCEGAGCGDSGIFSAKRAPASDLGHRRPVRLGHGITGWVGNYGCAFNGTDPDWGPRYCGRSAIVWHQAGVNYCIEAPSLTDADLIIAARQAVAATPGPQRAKAQ